MTSEKSSSRKSTEFGQRPMWCDDFDMDLPKVIPEAREILGDLGDVMLWTAGSETDGVLNHPCVWNHERGMVAFFGFRSPARPAVYYSSDRDVRCTAWEAFRDAWPHTLVMLVEQQGVWDTGELRPQFETIMFDLRGWRLDPDGAEQARALVRRSLSEATIALGQLVARHRHRVERSTAISAAAAGALADG